MALRSLTSVLIHKSTRKGSNSSRISTRRFSQSTQDIGYDHSRVVDVRKKGKAGDKIVIKGWIKTVRSQKANMFIEVNDGSSIANLQVVADSSWSDKISLSTGTSIEVQGQLTSAPGGSGQLELLPSSIKVLGACDNSYPLAKKKHSLEFLREIAHLRPRGNTFAAVMRVRNAATMAIHNFFQKEGFINVHTPIISANDCEGAGELFMVSTRQKVEQTPGQAAPAAHQKDWNHFFNVPEAYLTVSGQLDAEIFACAMGRVYTFGPTFRAEKSNTPRHLAEFWMVEPEVAFLDLEGDMQLAERFIKSVVREISDACQDDISFFEKWVDPTVRGRIDATLKENFARVEYTNAVEILKKAGHAMEWGQDLERAHERYLCEEYYKKPVFVINWPKTIKPFYMKLNVDGKTVACMDLLVPRIGEVIGGSAREDNFDLLVSRMKDMGLSVESNQWYTDLRKFGSVPHAGFGLGFERLLLYVTGMENIRDVIPIPRHPGYCKF